MTQRFWVMSLVAVCIAIAAQASHAASVVVEIIDSQGRVFQQVPTKAEAHASRAYLEAERDARYRIRIRNLTDARVGVVVAVDGRNIISGARSDLGNNEPMYLIDRWDTQEYSGWRASLSEVNEFYFTDWKDSYAEAFGDASARGVIAVAVYREKESRLFSQEREHRANGAGPAAREPASAAPPPAGDSSRSEAPTASAPPPPAADSSAATSARITEVPSGARDERHDKAESTDAGTGYGDRRTEYVTQVEFDAESRATQRVFLKYEWHETLCRRHILNCEDPPNRFWPNNRYGFAPPPPGRTR